MRNFFKYSNRASSSHYLRTFSSVSSLINFVKKLDKQKKVRFELQVKLKAVKKPSRLNLADGLRPGHTQH